MVDRITITRPTFMNLDGQPQIVWPGTVVDVPTAAAYSAQNSTITTRGSGTLASHGGPTPVTIRKGPG